LSILQAQMHIRFLFRLVKAAELYFMSIKSYSKNTHPSFILKRIVGTKVGEHFLFSCYLNHFYRQRLNSFVQGSTTYCETSLRLYVIY
jgi:hypothetical protein